MLAVFSVLVELLIEAGVVLADCGTARLSILGDLGGTFGGRPSSTCESDGRYASAGSKHSL